MHNPLAVLRGLSRAERLKAGLLGGWFFLVITTLSFLKPIRSASLLTHLGSQEIPNVRLAAVAVVALVVALYTRVVDRYSRLQVARGASILFALLLIAFWLALQLGGQALGGQRWFVWSVFIMVDVYSTVMVGLFWTYTNDVMLRTEADALYGPIGIGGILGGVAGGAAVDALVHTLGHVNLLLVCAGLGVASAVLVTRIEGAIHPPPRRVDKAPGKLGAALEGLRRVFRDRYLLLIVGIVVGYEFAAAMTDFVVNVVFEARYQGQEELAKMFGRLVWIVSATALASQVLLVPAVLSRKRLALLLPPAAMAVGILGLSILPVVAMALVMSAADRGLNYSLQQVTKETLYVPLADADKYKAKAFIDMVVDRAGKAVSAIVLLVIIAAYGVDIEISLAVAGGAVALWLLCAIALGRAYQRKVGAPPAGEKPPLAVLDDHPDAALGTQRDARLGAK